MEKDLTVKEIIQWHEEQSEEAWASNEINQWLFHLNIASKLAVSFDVYPIMKAGKN